MGEKHATKRTKKIGQFMDVKAEGNRFKGVRKEHLATENFWRALRFDPYIRPFRRPIRQMAHLRHQSAPDIPRSLRVT